MNVIDVFAGAGGLGLGFKNAGFNIALSIEMDSAAAETYKLNNPETLVINENIENVIISDYNIPKICGVIGGPPCQGFSLSGKRDPKDPRNSLFMEFIRIVKDVKPNFFVMENVKGLLSMKTLDNKYVKDIILEEFNKIGYKTTYRILDSSNFGVPQKRERVFFIGVLEKTKCLTNLEVLYPNKILKPISIAEAIDDLPYIEASQSGENLPYKKEPSNEYQSLMRKNNEKVYNHISMKHTNRIIERFSLIKEGQSLKDVPIEHMQRKRGNSKVVSGKVFSQNNMRPYYDKPSPTITASFQSNFVHPKINRNFTAREACRLQSFPDNYIFTGKRTTMSWEKNLSQYQQIGNAVPPLLAQKIAEKIYNFFEERIENE